MNLSFFNTTLILFLSIFSLSFASVFAQEANLGDLVVRFCNDEAAAAAGGTSSLSMTAEGGEEEDICLYLSNGGQSSVTMKLNFVDGTVTNDTDQKKACQPEGTKTRFGQFIDIPKTEYRLQAGQSLEVHATAEFPTSYAGMAYGCVTYQAVSDSQASNGMFNVLTRKANFIDILVKGEIKLGLSLIDQNREDNLSDSAQLVIFQDPSDGTYKAQIILKNEGNVAQNVEVKGSVNTRFDSAELLAQTKKVLPEDSIDFIFPIDDFLPRYDGAVTTTLDITHTPVFEFESDEITDDMRKSNSQIVSTKMFFAPWKLLALLIALLLIIFALSRYRKTKKNSHVQTVTHTETTTVESTEPMN